MTLDKWFSSKLWNQKEREALNGWGPLNPVRAEAFSLLSVIVIGLWWLY